MNYIKSDPVNRQVFVAEKDFHKVLEKHMGSRFREYRLKWNFCMEELPSFPIQLDINFDFKCNLKCRNCIYFLGEGNPIRRAFGDPKARLPFKVFKGLIDEGTRKEELYALNLCNFNEPLIDPKLPDAIKYARRSGLVDVFFNTNAVLLDEKKSLEVLDAEPTRIGFSLDAILSNTYKKLRGSDLCKVMWNIDRFLKLKAERGQKLPITRASFVVMKQNQKELNEFIDYWKDKIDYFCIQNYHNMMTGTKYFEEIKRELSLVIREQRNFTCTIPFQRLPITASGDALSCCFYIGFLQKVGNIYKNSIHEIWGGEKMQRVRETANSDWNSKTNVCKLCHIIVNAPGVDDRKASCAEELFQKVSGVCG